MPPPAAVKPSHGPGAEWTPRPYCSHSTHLLHPPLSSSPSLSWFPLLLSQKMGAEIPFCPTNQIILYCHFPSPLCLSLPPRPPHSIILLSFLLSLPPSDSPSHPAPITKGHLKWWKMQVKGWGIFPFLRCNPIRSAGDVGLRRHRRHGSCTVRFLISAVPFVAGVMREKKTHLITAAFCIVAHSASYPSGMTFQCHQSGKVSPVCSAHSDLPPFAMCHVHHQT